METDDYRIITKRESIVLEWMLHTELAHAYINKAIKIIKQRDANYYQGQLLPMFLRKQAS